MGWINGKSFRLSLLRLRRRQKAPLRRLQSNQETATKNQNRKNPKLSTDQSNTVKLNANLFTCVTTNFHIFI